MWVILLAFSFLGFPSCLLPGIDGPCLLPCLVLWAPALFRAEIASVHIGPLSLPSSHLPPRWKLGSSTHRPLVATSGLITPCLCVCVCVCVCFNIYLLFHFCRVLVTACRIFSASRGIFPCGPCRMRASVMWDSVWPSPAWPGRFLTTEPSGKSLNSNVLKQLLTECPLCAKY